MGTGAPGVVGGMQAGPVSAAAQLGGPKPPSVASMMSSVPGAVSAAGAGVNASLLAPSNVPHPVINVGQPSGQVSKNRIICRIFLRIPPPPPR